MLPTTPARVRAEWFVDVLVASLPLLASIALYLPSGVLMPFRVAAFGCMVAAAVVWWRDRQLHARWTFRTVSGLSICFALFGGIAALRYPNDVSVDDAIKTFSLLALAVAMAVVVRRQRTVVALVVGWVVAAAVSAVPGIWEVATGHHLPGNMPARYHAGVIPGWNSISSFFDNPNLYAYQCALVILLLPVVFAVTPRRWQWAWVPFGALLAYLLLWTDGRIAALGLIVGIAAWALRSRVTRWVMAGGVTLFALAAWLQIPPTGEFVSEASNVLVQLNEEGASTWVRVQLAKSGWWMLEQSSFLGVGPGGFASWALHPDNPYPYHGLNSAHSGLIEVGSQYGLLTAFAVIGLLVATIIVTVRHDRASGQRWSINRVVAVCPAILALTWPLLSATHSSWLSQPLAAAHVATMVALAAWSEQATREATP